MSCCPSCGLVRGLHNSILQGCTCQWQMMDARVTFRELRDEAELKAAVAAEREACAKVIDDMADYLEKEMEPDGLVAWVRQHAAEIRDRE